MKEVFSKKYTELSESDMRKLGEFIRGCLTYSLPSIKMCDAVSVWIQIEMAYGHSRLSGINIEKSDVTEWFYRSGKGSLEEQWVRGHFAMFSNMVRSLSSIDSLNGKFINELHRYLVRPIAGCSTGYRNVEGDIFGSSVCPYEQVSDRLNTLLKDYMGAGKGIRTMCILNARYLSIKPFEFGSVRTGLMVLFRECISMGLMTIIIREQNLGEYKSAILDAKQSGKLQALAELYIKEQEWLYNNIREIHRRVGV